MEPELVKIVKKAKSRVDLYRAPRLAIENTFAKPCSSGKCSRNLNVAVVAAPCHGFGDIIFASKFAHYLKNGFGRFSRSLSKNVTIITPAPEMFEKLGVKDIKIVALKGATNQCRRLRNYKRPSGLPKFDLIFIAPLMISFKIDYADVKALFKESTPFNTLFLSEYQDKLNKGFDINTGVGEKYDGLLFDDVKIPSRLKALGSEPYALAYLAKDAGPRNCLANFIKMIVAKYHTKHPRLQIVIPEWATKALANNKALRSFVKKNGYPSIVIRTKEGEKFMECEFTDDQGCKLSTKQSGVLILRTDILPVSRPEMLSLMKHSIPDVLVTGDQSVTDVIDCCQSKNIWYQTVSWKKNLAKALAKELPQKYLASANTSCGSLNAIKWNNAGTKFKSQNDFRKKARGKIEAAFLAASMAAKKGTVIHDYLGQLKKSANKDELLDVISD